MSSKHEKKKAEKAADDPPPVKDKSKSKVKDKSREKEKEKSKSKDKERTKNRERPAATSTEPEQSQARPKASSRVRLQEEPTNSPGAAPVISTAQKSPRVLAPPLSSQLAPNQILSHPDVKLHVEALLQAILDHSPAVVTDSLGRTQNGEKTSSLPGPENCVFSAKLQDIASLSDSARHEATAALLGSLPQLRSHFRRDINVRFR